MIANGIPIRAMEVPCAMKGKKKKKVEKERKKEKKKGEVESRRWEGSAGKDERQQKETSTTVWWVFVPIESPSLPLSLFLRFFPLSSSPHLSESSVSRTGTVAGLSGTGLDQLFFSLFLFLSLCSTVNVMIMSAPANGRWSRDLSIEFPSNSVHGGAA